MKPRTILQAGDVRVRALCRDALNRVRYGPQAPRMHELIRLRPKQIRTALGTGKGVAQSASGTVVGGDWDLGARQLLEVAHIRQCVEHWRDGKTWEETGAIDHALRQIAKMGGRHAGMSSRDDVVRRYESVDRLLADVRAAGVLKTRRELGNGFRERGGILIHIDRHGEPVFNGWSGCHRLAAAMHLDLESIPVQIGRVHLEAVRTWRRGITSE